MSSFQIAAVLGVIALLLWQSYVSFLVIRSSAYSIKQKCLQVALVWLLPVVGVALVHWFAGPGTAPLTQSDKEFLRQDIPAPGVTKVNW